MEEVQENSSSLTPQMKYDVRTGTINLGNKYEYKMATLLCLRCVRNQEDMWIAFNVDKVGEFDDIVLHQGNKTFMLQLKHKEDKRPIPEREFLAPKGDFSLKKYFQGIIKAKVNINSMLKKPETIDNLRSFTNIYFILFTNKDVGDYQFLEKSPETFETLLNTASTTNSYKIDVKKLPNLDIAEASSDIYLLVNQVHAKSMDNKIAEEIQELTKHFKLEQQYNIKDIAEKFTKYVTDWADGELGGHYCLTKQDVICKLTELFCSKYQVNLTAEKHAFSTCKNKHVWKNIIRDKTLTLVDFDEDVSKFLIQYVASEVKEYCKKSSNSWTNSFSSEAQALFYQEQVKLKTDLLKIVGNHGKLTLMDVYKCLWVANVLPLLLEINESQQYHDLLRILKLSNNVYNVVVINKSGGLISMEKNAIIKSFYTLQDLSEEERKTIMKQPVTFQGKSSAKLEDLIDDNMLHYVKTSDIVNILLEKFNIGGCLNPLPDYFIIRSISKIFVRSEVLKEVKDDMFLIEGNFEKHFQMQSQVCKLEECNHNKLDECRIIVSSKGFSEKHLEILKPIKRSIHHLMVNDVKYFEWKASLGSTTNIRQFQVELENVVESDVRNRLSTPVNIVSGVPGMGKSVLMDYVAEAVPSNKWVLRIDLNRHQNYYKNNTCKHLTATSHFEHLEYFKDAVFERYNCNTPLANAIFKKMTNTEDIIVLLDGFDEISISHKEEVTNIAKAMLNGGYKLWLTTRPHMTSHLQEELNTFCVTLKPFSESDQKHCLTQYFRTKYVNSEPLIEEFVEKLLTASKKNLKDQDAKFAGIPLLTQLLADMFKDDCKKFISSRGTVLFKENFNLVDLYQHFTNKQDQIFDSKFGSAAKDFLNSIPKEHPPLFALKLLFPSHGDLFVKINQEMDDYYKGNPEKIQLLQRNGVLTADNNFNINFIHRTFAEYLAARWISQNLQSSNEKNKRIAKILFQERFTQQFRFLFRILDQIFAQSCPLHLAVINQQKDQAIKSAHFSNELDAGGRSVLHLIALYSVEYPRLFYNNVGLEVTYYADEFLNSEAFNANDMLQLIREIPNFELDLLLQKTDILGYTPLDYALANRSLTIANKFNTILTTSLINIHIPLKFKREYLGYCALLNYKTLFRKLLLYFASEDLLSNNVNKNDGVNTYCFSLFCILGEFLKDLPRHSAKIFYFLKRFEDFSSISILQLLQSGRGISYSGWNGRYYSDIRYAICFGSEENVRKLLARDASNVNKSDIGYNTPLHYAVLHGKPDIVKSLLQKGAAINRKNIEKCTPLHLAAKAKELNKFFFKHKTINGIVTTLVANGTNVNIQNADGNTPLHLAMLTKKLSCSKCCIVKYKNIDLQNRKGETIVHLVASNGWHDILKTVPFKREDIDKQDNNGWSPIFTAVCRNNLDTVKFLISNGASVNVQCNSNLETPLHVAVQKGFNGILKELLVSKNIDIDKQDYFGMTPLFYAASNRQLDTVKFLISNGANVNTVNGCLGTPLHIAVKKGFNDILNELLLSKNIDIDKQDYSGMTPLFYAASNRQLDTVKFLISNGASVNTEGKYLETVLHIAAKKGFDDILEELLLSKNIDIDKQDNLGQTPLFYAASSGQLDIVKLLISKGANTNTESEYLGTPLHIAAGKGFNDILEELLVSKNIDIGKQDDLGKTPLFYAASSGQLHTVKFLISNGASVNTESEDLGTLLPIAAGRGFNYILEELLLSKNIDIDKQDYFNETPLFCAAYNGQLDTVKFLISNGANVNTVNGCLGTPLHIAVKKGFNDILKELLLSKNIDIDKQDYFGMTPLFYAASNRQLDTVKFLISNGANVNTEGKYLETVLHIAAKKGFDDILEELLLSINIDIDKQDNLGQTPLFYAASSGQLDTVKFLISKGANTSTESEYLGTPLHIAAGKGFNDILEELLVSKNIDIDKQDDLGKTPLFYAASSGQLHTVNFLISKGASVNTESEDLGMLLHIAAERRGFNYISEKLLLSKNIDINK